MNYADSLGLLKTIAADKYVDAIRDGIDNLGAKMEAAGYDPADIRRYFRMVLAKLAGRAFAECCWDFFVWSRAAMLFRYAEKTYDRKYPNSLGLLWRLTFDRNEGIDRCRWDADYLEHGSATEEHLELARQKEEALRQRFAGLTILSDTSSQE